ncbi:hypothetical protein [Methanosarcina sp. MSH10X1]|nr:hypothetical protein [Methanosarcina sp. MSH10X1]
MGAKDLMKATEGTLMRCRAIEEANIVIILESPAGSQFSDLKETHQ